VNRRLRGYAETLGAGLINGSIGVFVTYATMPATMLVAVRMVFAGLVLGVVVAMRRDWKALFADRGTTIRLLVCGIALAVNLVSYFIAIRQTGVGWPSSCRTPRRSTWPSWRPISKAGAPRARCTSPSAWASPAWP